MSSTTGRSTIPLATLILLAVLVGGCGGDSASPTAALATTTVAPTTTTVPTLDAEELAWLKGSRLCGPTSSTPCKPWAAGK